MTPRLRIVASIWVGVGILLRLYGINGGDAAIVGGLLFLVWTAPFGLIWQFYLYDHALQWMSNSVAQVVGDVAVIAVGFLFWFVVLPWLRSTLSRRGSAAQHTN